MLPRSRSIFHIEELACSSGAHATAISPSDGAASSSRAEASTSCSGRTSSDNSRLVGLQLLIVQRCSSGQLGAHLVTQHSIKPRSAPSSQLGFLKTCHLCNKELRPQMDVYVYRGEQGFCSAECREHQILVEERREFEAWCRRKPIQKPRHGVHFAAAKSKNAIRRWNQKSRMQAVS